VPGFRLNEPLQLREGPEAGKWSEVLWASKTVRLPPSPPTRGGLRGCDQGTKEHLRSMEKDHERKGIRRSVSVKRAILIVRTVCSSCSHSSAEFNTNCILVSACKSVMVNLDCQLD
jgi:hypothetical protein